MLGFVILAALFVAAMRMLLVVHAGWSRAGASLTAFAICPLLVAASAYSIGAIGGGLALMIGLPIAILARVAGVALAMLVELFSRIGDSIGSPRDED